MFAYKPQQTFPPIIWIFTEGKGDRIESSLPFRIFSTLPTKSLNWCKSFKLDNIETKVLELSYDAHYCTILGMLKRTGNLTNFVIGKLCDSMH